ncbi:MAG: ABC transporter permease [Cuniculiplasma sp.]
MNIRFIGTFAWYYGVKIFSRGPSYVIASLATPLSLLFIVYILTAGKILDFAVVGGVISLVGSIGLQSAGDATFMKLQLRVQEMYVASDVSPIDYMLALTMSFLTFSIPGIVVYVILGVSLGLYSLFTIAVMIFLLVLLTLSTSAIAFIISGLVKHVRNVWGIVGILAIIMTVIPPTFYPYTYLNNSSSLLIYVLSISPVTPAAVIAQTLFGLPGIPFNAWMLEFSFSVLILETVVFFAIAKYLIRWREN